VINYGPRGTGSFRRLVSVIYLPVAFSGASDGQRKEKQVRRFLQTKVIRATALAAAVSLAMAGCSSGSDDAGSRSGGDSSADLPVDADILSWSEEFCGHVTAGGADLNIPDAEEDPEKARQNLVEFLASLATQLTTLGDNMQESGPPPVEDGDVLLEGAMTSLNEAVSGLDTARESLEQADVAGDPEALAEAMTAAHEEMQGTDAYEGPAQHFRGVPELDESFNALTACREV
jgi:hypothetical protein